MLWDCERCPATSQGCPRGDSLHTHTPARVELIRPDRYRLLFVGTSARTSMVSVPAGRVTLSDRRLQQSWPVEVAAYELSAFPVTQELYAEVTGWWPGTARGDRLPVEGVTWWDAVRFCNLLSGLERLTPTYHSLVEGEDIEWDASPTATGSPLKPSGSTPAGRRQPAPGTGRSTTSPGTAATLASNSTPSAASSPTPGAYTTCWVTYGSGAGTSTTPTFTAPTECSVAVGGSTSIGAAGRRCGAVATRRCGSTTSGSGSRGRSSAEPCSREAQRRGAASGRCGAPCLDRDAGHRLGWGRPDVPATVQASSGRADTRNRRTPTGPSGCGDPTPCPRATRCIRTRLVGMSE